jgi:AcrR family transcriptional regulator
VRTVAPSPFELPMSAEPVAARERADARRNRERILCAAARLIEAKGMDCVSMDDVAAEAGVGKGTLYRRFGDRSALLHALIEEPERDFQEALLRGEPPLGPGAPPLDRLHAFGDALIDHLERHGAFVQAADTLAGGKRYTHPVYSAYRTHITVLLRDVLGDDPRGEFLADALLGALAAEPYLHLRQTRGMSVDDIRAGWHALADAVCAAA